MSTYAQTTGLKMSTAHKVFKRNVLHATRLTDKPKRFEIAVKLLDKTDNKISDKKLCLVMR